MSPVLHVGPAKTATKSIQKYIIPNLGRPFQVKPAWAKTLARGEIFAPPATLSNDAIISDENLADFAVFAPAKIAERLAQVANGGLVLLITRDPLERFYSIYRQNFMNALAHIRDQPSKLGRARLLSIDERFELDRRLYNEHGIGFFKTEDHDEVEAAFRKYFDFVRLPYGLLRTNMPQFVAQFCKACDCAPLDITLGHENITSIDRLEDVLSHWPCPVAQPVLDALKRLYLEPLSADRAEILMNLAPPPTTSID